MTADAPTVLEVGVKGLLDAIESPGPVPVFANEAPPEERAPYIVYQRITTNRDQWDHLQGAGHAADVTIQVAVYHTGYLLSKTLAGRVRQKLNGFRGTSEGVRIMSCRLVNELDLEEISTQPRLHRVNLDFLIIHAEN